jgi:hypothetical protein
LHSVHDFIRFVAAVFTHQLLSLKSLAGGKHAFLVHDLSVVLVHLEAVLVVHSVSWWRESTKPEWKGLMRCEQATLLLLAAIMLFALLSQEILSFLEVVHVLLSLKLMERKPGC